MTTRYLVIKEEPCAECDGTGAVAHGSWAHFCLTCQGKGGVRTEVDADEWLAAALVRNQDELQAALDKRTQTAFYLLRANGRLRQRVAELEGEWNPVDERLPPCSGDATLSERVEIVTQGTYHGHWRLWTAWNDSVIAWRPLPAQGESDQEGSS
jgi:hypothetical protein